MSIFLYLNLLWSCVEISFAEAIAADVAEDEEADPDSGRIKGGPDPLGFGMRMVCCPPEEEDDDGGSNNLMLFTVVQR